LTKDPHETQNLIDIPGYITELQRHRAILNDWMRDTDDKGQYPESTEGLLQVMYRWGDKCVNPEYKAVRNKYGNIFKKQRRSKP
jgi:hypothetical protein